MEEPLSATARAEAIVPLLPDYVPRDQVIGLCVYSQLAGLAAELDRLYNGECPYTFAELRHRADQYQRQADSLIDRFWPRRDPDQQPPHRPQHHQPPALDETQLIPRIEGTLITDTR